LTEKRVRLVLLLVSLAFLVLTAVLVVGLLWTKKY
jgi:hypothetical protein